MFLGKKLISSFLGTGPFKVSFFWESSNLNTLLRRTYRYQIVSEASEIKYWSTGYKTIRSNYVNKRDVKGRKVRNIGSKHSVFLKGLVSLLRR